MQTYAIHPSLAINDKVVFLTGAFGLIGQTVAHGFLAQGAKVVLADLDASKQEAVSEAMLPLYEPDRFLILLMDIRSEADCARAVSEAVKAFGRIDVLINNAAIDAKFDQAHLDQLNPSRFEQYPAELLRQSVDVNLTGTVLITQQVCKQMMLQGQGNIINVASTYSMVAPNQQLYDFGQGIQQYKPIDYIASKSFIPNFTRYVATFYAGAGIRCNAIVPHAIENQHSEAFKNNFSRLSPLGRMCEREELIGPFTFLASEASSYMTGSILTVDGGWTAW